MQHKLWLAVGLVALAPTVAIAVASQQPSPQELRLAENLRIGEVAGRPEYALTRASSIAIGRDSSILVQEGTSIRRFNSRGQFVRSYGRSGRGPGEFAMGIGHVGFVGDTIYAIDIFSRRITLFSPLGEVLQTVSFNERWLQRGTLFSANPSVLLPDGSAIGRAVYPGELEARGAVPRFPYLRATRAGEIADTVVWVTAQPYQPGSPRLHADLLDNQLSTVAPDGSRIVVVERGVSTSARTATFAVTAVNSQGDTLFRRSYQYSPKPVSVARRDSIVVRAGAVRDSGRIGAPTSPVTAAFAGSIPSYYPPISGAVVGSDGAIWLRREAGDSDWKWDILSLTGTVAGFVRIPKNSDLLAVDRQTVWLVERDSLDVPSLVRYRTVPR